MATQGSNSGGGNDNGPRSQTQGSAIPHRPTETLENTQSTSAVLPQDGQNQGPKKRRNHRSGKKKKQNRRQSFLPGNEEEDMMPPGINNRNAEGPLSATARPGLYRNLSDASINSEALLDHRYVRLCQCSHHAYLTKYRDHQPMRPRRDSKVLPSQYARHSNHDLSASHPRRSAHPARNGSYDFPDHQRRPSRAHLSSGGEDDDDQFDFHDRSPLLANTQNDGTSPNHRTGYGIFGNQGRNRRRDSTNSSKHRRGMPSRQPSTLGQQPVHDVNNPPSVPNSPLLGPDMGLSDVLAGNSFKSTDDRRGDQLIDIDNDGPSSPDAQRRESLDQRRHTIALPAEEDVCFPAGFEGMSAIGEEDFEQHEPGPDDHPQIQRRRRYRQWPDLSVLDEWSREEKEERSEGIRAKKISEPVLVGGRLRPQKHGWHREEEDAPYRFTYFNEEFPSTIHSQTISELLQPGQDFKELFVPDLPELSDESSDEDDFTSQAGTANERSELSPNSQSRVPTRHSSIIGGMRSTQTPEHSGDATPSGAQSNAPGNGSREKPKRYGERPTFWLDVLCPTDTEMRVISKTFGIHPLTAEDIMMQEAREKVELFRNYYFVNYRTFEQDTNSEDHLDPVNMYVVVFPEGVISFHFCMTPHPANVRRRIRQLRDYIKVSSDWISYAIIDDITDVFAPAIQAIEDEVDDIDDAILRLHSGEDEQKKKEDYTSPNEKKSLHHKNDTASIHSARSSNSDTSPSGSDMLRRVGEGRKKVMLFYRLLGNKADVIKGFAKRCNEKWEIAPRSDIGLYLGDIQDHILTMTSNLSHYETLLSRAHSNYLAQINIKMNERQEQTADVLGKLTVLGTIVLPMNIITGMWGMNVQVPGQDVENLIWFWSSESLLLLLLLPPLPPYSCSLIFPISLPSFSCPS